MLSVFCARVRFAARVRARLLAITSHVRMLLLAQAHAPAALATDRVASPPEFARDYSERLLYFADTFYLADHANSWHTRELAAPAALPAYSKAQVLTYADVC